MRLIVAVPLLALFLPAAPAQVPSGFRTFDDLANGIRAYYPKAYKPVPTQPTEKLILAKFSRETPYRAKKGARNRYPESFAIFRLHAKTTPKNGEVTGNTDPRTAAEAMDRRNAIHDYKSFMKSRYRGRKLLPMDEALAGARNGEEEHLIEGPRGRSSRGLVGARVGYLYVRHAQGMTFGLVGECDEVVLKQMIKTFRKVGRSLRLEAGTKRASDKAASFYKYKKKLRGIPFRIEARRNMVPGWKAFDTENFFIVSHTANKKFLGKLQNDLEAIRPIYEKYFPPTKPIEAVSVVRVCKDLKEYYKYGGRPGSAGYWNYVAQELVLFDFTQSAPRPGRAPKSKRRATQDNFIVVYHEAFHQYIFYAAGQIAPHSWFNEGLGDFFSGVAFYKNSSRIRGIDLNRWRIATAKKAALNSKAWVPLTSLMSFEQHQYYKKASICYSQGWALCYFLLETEEGQQDPAWSRIIPVYYEALKKAYGEMIAGLGAEANLAARRKVEADARARALKETVAELALNLKTLDLALRAWLEETKDPWASERPKR